MAASISATWSSACFCATCAPAAASAAAASAMARVSTASAAALPVSMSLSDWISSGSGSGCWSSAENSMKNTSSPSVCCCTRRAISSLTAELISSLIAGSPYSCCQVYCLATRSIVEFAAAPR